MTPFFPWGEMGGRRSNKSVGNLGVDKRMIMDNGEMTELDKSRKYLLNIQYMPHSTFDFLGFFNKWWWWWWQVTFAWNKLIICLQRSMKHSFMQIYLFRSILWQQLLVMSLLPEITLELSLRSLAMVINIRIMWGNRESLCQWTVAVEIYITGDSENLVLTKYLARHRPSLSFHWLTDDKFPYLSQNIVEKLTNLRLLSKTKYLLTIIWMYHWSLKTCHYTKY